MKTVPEKNSATFVSMAQSIQFLASTIAPAIATIFADNVGLAYTLWLASGIQLTGFLLFWLMKPRQKITLQRS